MPYKNRKNASSSAGSTSSVNKGKPKKQTGLVILLVILSIFSLSFVAAIIGLETGAITFPTGTFPDFPILQQYERPANATPDTGSDSVETKGEAESSKPPPEPPKLTFNGSFNEATIAELKGILAKYPWSVAVYYENLSTGSMIEFNSKHKFPAGSVVKAPYCKWLLTTDPDLTEVLTMEKSSIAEGDGKLNDLPIGSTFTVAELIQYALVDSDNTAYQMLTQKYGFDGYLAYVKNMGVGSNVSKGNLFGSLSPAGTAVLFKDIYNFGNSDPARSELLLTSMKSTAYAGAIGKSVDATVAHKYGWNGGSSGFHDAAIVYHDVPYVLTIFSSMNYDKSGTEEYIKSIAKCIDKLHFGN